MSKSKTLLVLSLMVLLSACATVRAPADTVPKRKDLVTEAYGGWIGLRLITPADSFVGEFIALGDDSLYMMRGASIVTHAISNISWARIVFFKTESEAYAVWTVLASLLTISNGYYAGITLPITLVTGISTSIGEAKRKNYLDYPATSFKEFSKYARFPQGMPKGINPADLKPRPLP